MCDIDGAEQCDVYTQKKRRAIKDHRCYECRRAILKGEVYSYETAVWDGTAETMKVCAHCESARQWMADQCGGYVFGSLLQELYDHFRDGHKEIGRLVVMMQNKWQRVRSSAQYSVEQVDRFTVRTEAA